MKMYGINNCDTVRKAKKWLTEHGITVDFHDFKKAGIDETHIHQWLAQVDWTVLVNKRGTTWRQ